MQIQNDVFLPGGDLGDDLIHDAAVVLAALVPSHLIAAEAEPPILRQGQPDGVGMPYIQCMNDSGLQLFRCRQPFQRGTVDAGEQHPLALFIEELIALHMQLLLPIFFPIQLKHHFCSSIMAKFCRISAQRCFTQSAERRGSCGVLNT